MGDKYDYHIATEKLNSPIGGSKYHYAAKLERLVINPGPNVQVVPFSEHQIGEVWGVTEDEARQKLTKMINEWIASRG